MDDDAKAFLRALMGEFTRSICDSIDALSAKFDNCATVPAAAPTHTICSMEDPSPALISAAALIVPPATGNAVPVDAASSAVVVEVAAHTCSMAKQDTHFPSSGVTTMALLPEGVSELVIISEMHHDSSSATIIELETLDVDPAAPTSFISTALVTCSTECVPQLAMVVPLLDASSSSTPSEYGLNTNNVRVAAAPRAITCVFPVVSASVVVTPMIQLQQLYVDSEFFRSDSGWCLTGMVLVNRFMPWPSFMEVHANGVETRPLPWPTFRQKCVCESNDDLDMKLFWRSTTASSPTTVVKCLELKLSPTGSTLITILVPSAGGNLVALSYEYWVIDNSDCVSSSLIVGSSADVCLESSVHPSTHCIIAREYVSRLLGTMDWHFLYFSCCAFVTICAVYSQVLGHYLNIYQPMEALLLTYIGRTTSSSDQLSCAIWDASCWPGSVVTGIPMLFTAADHRVILARFQNGQKNSYVMLLPWVFEQEEYLVTRRHPQVSTDCSTWKLLLSGSSAIFTLAKFLEWTWEPNGILLYDSQWARAKSFSTLWEFEHCCNFKLQTRLSWKSDFVMEWNVIVLACLRSRQKNLHVVHEVQPAKLPDATRGLLMVHFGRLEPVILGALLTWPYFSMDNFTILSPKVINCRSNAVSSVQKLWLQRYSSIYTWISFGVGLWNDMLLQECNFSWYSGHITMCGFELPHCQIAVSLRRTSMLPSRLSSVHVHGQTYTAAICITEVGGTIGDMETMPFIAVPLQLSFPLLVKAPLHSSVACLLKLSVQWVAASGLEDAAATSAPDAHAPVLKPLKRSSCILRPAGFGDRGISRLIWAAKIACENKFPGVGICLGMHLSVIESSSHVFSLGDIKEFNAYTPDSCMTNAPVIIDPQLWSQSGKTIRLIWLWYLGIKKLCGCHCCAALLSAPCADEYGMVTRKLYRILVQRRKVPWDPGGFTGCRRFFTYCDQAPFQGGRYTLTSFEQVYSGHKFCLDFGNIHASVSSNDAYYLDQVYNDFKYYRQDYGRNPNRLNGVHAPWDPGKSALGIRHKLRLGDKPSFKEGGLLGTVPADTRTWAGPLGRKLGLAHQATRSCSCMLHIRLSRQRPRYPVGSRRNGGSLSHPRLYFPNPNSCCSR